MTEMFADLFKELKIPQPSPEEFAKLMGPILREAQSSGGPEATRMSAMEENVSFYRRLREELKCQRR